MALDSRLRKGLAILALIAVVAAGLGYAATVTIQDSGRFKTDSGLVVYSAGDATVQSGNPFDSPTSVTIEGIRFNGSAAEARIDAFNASGWTNLSQMSVQGGAIYVDRPGTAEVGVEGTVDSFALGELDLARENRAAELDVTTGGAWSLHVKETGLSEGAGVVVEDPDTGEILMAEPVQQDGSVDFNGLSAVDGPLNIRRGPSELQVFKASSPSELVDGVTLTIRVFDQDGQIWQREVSNGVMDLTGIPMDEPLTVTVAEDSATPYVYRRTVIQSAGQQQEIYLLNSSATTTANVIFDLEDRTGNYPPQESMLLVKRPITKDFDNDGTDETRYQNVVGDTFGTGSFPTILERNQRYRLLVQNQDGRQRVIGSYVAQLDDRSTIRLTGVSIPVDQRTGYAADITTFREDTDDDGTKENFLRFVYRDPAKQTEWLSWTLTSGKTDGTIDQGTTDGPLSKYVMTIKVPHNTQNTSYELDWSGSREQSDGSDREISGTVWGGDVPDIPLPIDPKWLELLGLVTIVAVAGLVVLIDTALGAVAASVTAGLLTVLGIVDIPMPALGLAGMISLVALIGRRR